MSPRRIEATQLLNQAARGEAGAARELIPLVYDELRELAQKYFRRERSGHTLQPTALVNEVYVRLIDQNQVALQGRTHFLAIAAREMRYVLVEHARRRRAAKRGGKWSRVRLDEMVVPTKEKEPEILDLEEALGNLSKVDQRESKVVELRFFGGLKIDETAQVLGVSPRTVRDDWHMARAWLASRLSQGGNE